MMKGFLNRFQVALVSVLLLVTFGFMLTIVLRFNHRWDLTSEKLYSLSKTTRDMLSKMSEERIEVFAFYPSNEAQKEDFELFLRECQLQHPQFEYYFYHPNRRPQLAQYWHIKDLYTVIIRYQDRQERLLLPDEEAFASALLRLLSPREISLCFLNEPGDERLNSDAAEGFGLFRELLVDHNYRLQFVSLTQKDVPSFCEVVVVPGPQSDWTPDETELLNQLFARGQSLLLFIDPMDSGTGRSFIDFMEGYNVQLRSDVIVDKMSRMMGGDFLLPFVNQYAMDHSLMEGFDTATFFPVARSVFPLAKEKSDFLATSIAFSSSNSWAETNLAGLENGEAAFETETDFPGPISLAVAVEKAKDVNKKESWEDVSSGDRMVVVGDSDFVTNAYLRLSGNQDFVLRLLQWLARDDRYVVLEDHHPKFQPLLLDGFQRFVLLLCSLLIYPLFFLLVGFAQNIWRRKTA